MLQIGESKFKIGDAITKEFKGQVEGVEVTVRKTLYVIAVKLDVEASPIRYAYSLGEKWPGSDKENAGKQYHFTQNEMPDVEPLINAIARAQAEAAQ